MKQRKPRAKSPSKVGKGAAPQKHPRKTFRPSWRPQRDVNCGDSGPQNLARTADGQKASQMGIEKRISTPSEPKRKGKQIRQ